MFNQTEKEKIKRFLSDKVQANAVKNVLREAFLKKSGNTDVQTLAAERIAINLLEDGFKELGRYSNILKREEKDGKNIGL